MTGLLGRSDGASAIAAPTSHRFPDTFTVEPPQLDPAPAVQPKQWRPVTIARPISRAGSKSKIVCGEGSSTGNSSIWLKSQS